MLTASITAAQRAHVHVDQRRSEPDDHPGLDPHGTGIDCGRYARNLCSAAQRPLAHLSVTPIADAVSQTTRASLVAQYNQIIKQITTTAQDASFNGVNLLNGDTLKLVFNETGKSTLDDRRRDLQPDRSRPGVRSTPAPTSSTTPRPTPC